MLTYIVDPTQRQCHTRTMLTTVYNNIPSDDSTMLDDNDYKVISTTCNGVTLAFDRFNDIIRSLVKKKLNFNAHACVKLQREFTP